MSDHFVGLSYKDSDLVKGNFTKKGLVCSDVDFLSVSARKGIFLDIAEKKKDVCGDCLYTKSCSGPKEIHVEINIS